VIVSMTSDAADTCGVPGEHRAIRSRYSERAARRILDHKAEPRGLALRITKIVLCHSDMTVIHWQPVMRKVFQPWLTGRNRL
jgi:hypothetical protein